MPARLTHIELESKSDRELLLLTADHVNSLCGLVAQQNGRIGKLEQWRNKAAGVIALAMFVIPMAISIVASIVIKLIW